ncbi:zinc finger BED domain-containing protein 4-like [Macrosteles quadrilineatus]|uniref:zinc finger BED domain-containing protein 4-like n=1 Tax=Macrosteles quadrilineatus TaxID=74068 RepID=UPI0023E33A2C|nr:zinc finger BED domain-containing protein 4-like [Macrosteles quadrilineatus]
MENVKIANLVKKAKKVVGCFKKSAKNTKLLKGLQKQLNIPEHRLIQDEPTRWNTTFYMLKRLVEQKDALTLMSGKPEVSLPVELTSDDFRTMQTAVEILEIFETATRQVSKESSSISEIIPLINTIAHFLENLNVAGSGLMGLKNDLVSSLKRRYPNVEEDSSFAIATILDPRFKSAPFQNERALEAAKIKILDEMGRLEEVLSEPPAEDEQSRNENQKNFWSHYSLFTKASQTVSVPSSENSTLNELQMYLSEKLVEHTEDKNAVYTYWKCTHFLKLKKIATKYMCIPPATVFSERLFSSAGLICDKKRNRLDPERVKQLVFLHKNLQ